MNIEHYIVRSAVFVTVSHWLHGHPWAFPVVIVLVLVFIIRRRLRGRTARAAGAGRRPANVDELVRPTTGKGHWEWQSDR